MAFQVVAEEELRRAEFWMAFEGFPDGLGQEWKRKQSVKDVSRFFPEQLKGELNPAPMTNSDDKCYC